MAFGDLAQALAAAAVAEDSFAIDSDGLSSDVPALEPGSPHAGFHSLDDQVAFELSATAPMMTTMARPSAYR